jgi:hypothetical protein
LSGAVAWQHEQWKLLTPAKGWALFAVVPRQIIAVVLQQITCSWTQCHHVYPATQSRHARTTYKNSYFSLELLDGSLRCGEVAQLQATSLLCRATGPQFTLQDFGGFMVQNQRYGSNQYNCCTPLHVACHVHATSRRCCELQPGVTTMHGSFWRPAQPRNCIALIPLTPRHGDWILTPSFCWWHGVLYTYRY